MRFIPLGERVLVAEIPLSKVTSGGVHLPENASEQYTTRRGKVIDIGCGVPELKLGLDNGQVVRYSNYAGYELITCDEGKFKVLGAEEILAIEIE